MNLKYIHVANVLYISIFYEQENILEIYLKIWKTQLLSAREKGVWKLRKLSKIRNQCFWHKQINTARTNSSIFEKIILKANFKINYSSMFICLVLAVAETANLGLFIISILYFFK